MSWLSLDPTTVCVVFLILTLSSLWAYVTIAQENLPQPDFSVLHEVPLKSTTGQQGTKKAPKTKGKRKQVDGTHNPNPQTLSKSTKKKTVASTTTSSGSEVNSGPQEAKPSSKVKSGPQETKPGSKVKSGPQDAKPGSKVPQEAKPGSKVKSGPQEEKSSYEGLQEESYNGSVELERGHLNKKHEARRKQQVQYKSKVEGESKDKEEEWQTQLSRPQLKALRQKQRHSTKKVKQEADGQLGGNLQEFNEPGAERLQADTMEPSSESNAVPMKGSKKVASRKSKVSHVPMPKVSSSGGSTMVGGEKTLDLISKPKELLSHEMHVPSSLPVCDVEMALTEAAHSGLPSAEEERNAVLTASSAEKIKPPTEDGMVMTDVLGGRVTTGCDTADSMVMTDVLGGNVTTGGDTADSMAMTDVLGGTVTTGGDTADSMVMTDVLGGTVTTGGDSSGQQEDWDDLGNQDEWVVIN